MQWMKWMGALAVAAMVAFGSPASAGEETILMEGSTTVGPIAKAFAEYYMKNHEGVNITVSESGSGNGAKAIVNNSCQIANLSRFMKEAEFKAAADAGVMPVAHVVAMDGIAVIVHPSNPVKDLTVAQLRDIYTGKTKSWDELGGPKKPIVIVSRDTNSGTYETFESLVMHKEKMAEATEYVNSNVAARERVRTTDGAIAYVGLSFIDKSIKALTVEKITPTPRTVASGVYPVSRPLFMFTNGYPKLGSHVFQLVTLHLSPEGQKIIEEIGFVPVTSYK